MSSGKWSGKTAVVTGGTGFIGSHFVEELLAAGADVTCLYRRDNRGVLPQLPRTERLRPVQCDALDEHALGAVFDALPQVDAVFHCAVVSGTWDFRREHSAQILDTNMRTVSNTLRLARRHSVPEVVILSSSDVYLSPTTDPIREDDDFHRQMHYHPDGYYLSKTYTEVLAETYRNEYGMNIYLPRLTSVYGPRDNFEVDTTRVVPSMFAKAVSGQDIEIWGDGSQTRTYMYVTDLVRAILQTVGNDKYQTINVGTAETVSVLQLAQYVCAALGQPERITFLRDKSGGRPSRNLDLGRLDELIDFRPRTLREGLEATVDWYRRHRPYQPLT